MSIHLVKEIDKLRKQVLKLAGIVEENLLKASSLLQKSNTARLNELFISDENVDALEVEVEEECLKTLALHQPVAADLRYIICILKMNNDLERIGDLAVNIAKKASKLGQPDQRFYTQELYHMAEIAISMVHDALNTLINSDVNLAKEICRRDDQLDDIKANLSKKLMAAIKVDAENAEDYIYSFGIVRNIERIGDLATNICEDVIYSLTGEIIRHNYISSNE